MCVCVFVWGCVCYKRQLLFSSSECSNILSFYIYDFIKNVFSSKSNNNRITITTRIVDVVVVIVHAFWFDFAINNRSYESSTIIIIFSVLFCLNNYICLYRIVLVFSYLSDKYYTLSSRFSSCSLMCHFISI